MEVGLNNSMASQQQENTRRKKERRKEAQTIFHAMLGEVVVMQVGIATTSIGVVAFLIVNEIAKFGANHTFP
jgi:hypothetical protein